MALSSYKQMPSPSVGYSVRLGKLRAPHAMESPDSRPHTPPPPRWVPTKGSPPRTAPPRITLQHSTVSLYAGLDGSPETAPTPSRGLLQQRTSPLQHMPGPPRGWNAKQAQERGLLSSTIYQSGEGPRRPHFRSPSRPGSAALLAARSMPRASVQLPFEHLKPTPALAQSLSMLPIGVPASEPAPRMPAGMTILNAQSQSTPSLFGETSVRAFGARSLPAASVRPSTAIDSGVHFGPAEPWPPRPSTVAEPSTAAAAAAAPGTAPRGGLRGDTAGAEDLLGDTSLLLLAALRAVPHFAGLSDEQLQTLLGCAELVAHPRYAVVVREGVPTEASCAFYVVLAGQARVIQGQVDGVGGPLLGPGDSFGEALSLP